MALEKRHHVLVVQSDDLVLAILCRLLAHAGYDSIATRDAADALGELWRDAPVAAVVDAAMPGLGGTPLIDTLGRYWPELPVVVTRASSHGRDDLARLHAVAQLEKPFDLDAFHYALEAALTSPRDRA